MPEVTNQSCHCVSGFCLSGHVIPPNNARTVAGLRFSQTVSRKSISQLRTVKCLRSDFSFLTNYALYTGC